MRRRMVGAARGSIAVVIALALLAAAALQASAGTEEHISDAKRRLAALERQIVTERARVASVQTSLTSLAAEITFSRRQAEEIQARLTRTRTTRVSAETRYRAIRAEIAKVAREAYMEGPGYLQSAVLDIKTLSAATAIAAYANNVAARDADLAAKAHRLAAQLKIREKQESALTAQRNAVLSRLAMEQNALTKRFAEQQVRMANLARARGEMSSLLEQLRDRLRQEDLARALAAASGGTPLSFGKWAAAFLATAGFPVERNNLVVMVAWEAAEWTDARWNPLATTYRMPGSTSYNDSGVQNYVSLSQGLQATLKTLRASGYGYEDILAALARNADPMTTAQAIRASSWCSGCANGNYVVALIPSVEQYYDQYASAGT